MRHTTGTRKSPGEKIVKDIKRATRKQYSSDEKIRIVLDGLRGEDSIAELCRREGISQGVYYKWSKDFMEAGKRRLAGDTARAANTDEVKDLRREARDLNGLYLQDNGAKREARRMTRSCLPEQTFTGSSSGDLQVCPVQPKACGFHLGSQKDQQSHQSRWSGVPQPACQAVPRCCQVCYSQGERPEATCGSLQRGRQNHHSTDTETNLETGLPISGLDSK